MGNRVRNHIKKLTVMKNNHIKNFTVTKKRTNHVARNRCSNLTAFVRRLAPRRGGNAIEQLSKSSGTS